MTLTIKDKGAINVTALSYSICNVYLHKGVFSHVEWTSPEICEEGLSAGV